MARYKQPYSLYKRGKYYYYRTYAPNGARTSGVSTGQTSKAAAHTFCDALYKRGELWKSEKTFNAYLSELLRDGLMSEGKLAKNTEHAYEMFRRMLAAVIPDSVKVGDITYSYIKRKRKELTELYSLSSVKSMMTFWKRAMTIAYRDGLIARNPFEGLAALKDGDTRRDAFSVSEVETLCRDLRDFLSDFVILLACTGMRVSEAAGVTREDIMEVDGVRCIHLTRQLIKHEYTPLKTKSARYIPITPELEALCCFDPYKLSTFYRDFVPIAKSFDNSEERKLCVHSLRHFFITDAKSHGIDGAKVETIAGHSLKGIVGVYTNFKPSDLADITEWQRETFARLKQAQKEPSERRERTLQAVLRKCGTLS